MLMDMQIHRNTRHIRQRRQKPIRAKSDVMKVGSRLMLHLESNCSAWSCDT